MNLPDIALLVAVTGLVVGIGAWLVHQRVRRGIERRSESRTRQMSDLIERAQCVLWESEVVLETDDWAWHMRLHPSEFCRQLFRGRIPEPRDDLWAGFQVEGRKEMDVRARASISGGKPGYEQEFRATREGRTYWLHENVSITRLGPDRFWLVGLVTDITAQREAEAARRQSELTIERILAHAQCMIWRATVIQQDGALRWPHFDMPHSRLSEQLFGARRDFSPERGFWDTLDMPEQKQMDARSTRAILTGAPGYDQQFPAINPAGRKFWLSERVSITRMTEGVWSLVGVVTDITPQVEAEAEARENRERLDKLLETADCMLWEASVTVQADDTLGWDQYIPPSALYRRIFGDPGPGGAQLRWDRLTIPEYPEMVARTLAAVKAGDTGYSQEFHIVQPQGDLWLRESVTIKHLGGPRLRMAGVIIDITAQRTAEAARQESELRLATLLEQADCMVWQGECRRRGPDDFAWRIFTPRSQLYHRLFGHDPEGHCHFDWMGRVPEFEEMRARGRKALTGGQPGYEQVFHFQHADGAVWLNERVKIKPLGPDHWELIGIITDITARRRSEDARQASEVRLVEILTRAECLLWEATAELTEDDWSWQFNVQPSLLGQKLFGQPRPQAEEGLWRKFDIPERPEMDRRCRTAMTEGWPGYEHVFHIMRPDGTPVWIRENVTIRALGQNRFSLVGVAVDITAARRAELALAEEKERLAVTLRAMHEAVVTTDTAGRIQFLNPAAAALLGQEAADCIGRPLGEVCALENAHSGEPVALPVAQVARGDVLADLPAHTLLAGPGDRRRVVEGCCAPIHAADSKVTGTVLVLRDVTEQDRLEQELVRATRLESVGVLAGGIAHDFNNILTAVMGNLALAQLDIAPDSPAGGSLRSAEKAALRARDLTQQLLTFAKGGEPVRAAVQLEAVVREMTSFALSGSQVKAHFDLAPDLWPADADKGQIGRVVQNLVINAVQAMPRGGSLRIVARNDETDGISLPGLAAGPHIQVAIIDTGEGIRPENLTRIFDPYFTTKQTGTGLGLAAVYSIIKKHHGHIEVESQPGRGTTFRFWLPALSQQRGPVDSQRPWGGEAPLKGRVLFMDDEEIIRNMAAMLLTRFGLAVDCTVDGAEAVAKYREARAEGRGYDLVIMDLTVPGGMGGLEALGRLREIDPQVKAVVSSGYSSDPVLANHREHGFAAVVAKPYEMSELARVLREVLPGA